MALITLQNYARMHNLSMLNVAERVKIFPMRSNPVVINGKELYEHSDIESWHKRLINTAKLVN